MPHQSMILHAAGTGDIDHRFKLPGTGRTRVVFCRCHFVILEGSGGSAGFALAVDDFAAGSHNATLHHEAGVGTGKDINLIFPAERRDLYRVAPRQGYRAEWTNPDSGNVRWGLAICLEPVEDE